MELLQQITDLWLSQIELAKKAKEEQFGLAARRAWEYLGRDYRPFYYEASGEHEFPDEEQSHHKPIIVGKSQEFVALMLPYIHAKVPHRLVSPSRPPLPPELLQLAGEQRMQIDAQDKARAWLMEFWLNYISHESFDLAHEARTALPEALVKGACVVWHELTDGPYGPMPASFYDTVDSLFIDPDAERLRDASYIIRRQRMSVWQIAERFNVDAEVLRGQYESSSQRSADTVRSASSEKGDVAEYYEIWSRMGVGHKLVEASQEMQDAKVAMDGLGRFVYLAVMPGVDHPLNVPPHVLEKEDGKRELRERMEWPLKLYEEVSDPWPCSLLTFYPNSRDPWGQSPLAGGLQCQIFLDRLYQFMMRRIRTSCRDIFICSEALEEGVLEAMESGKDFEIVKASGSPGVELKSLIEILQFPPVNKDIWAVVQMVERQFERATGMTPLLSGAQPDTTPRSATDVKAREEHVTSRPDNFAELTEDWMSRIAAKQSQITRLYIEPPYELFGEPRPAEGQQPGILGQLWSDLITTEDPVVAASELSYTVEAGSGRRRNKMKQAADASQMIQVLSQPFIQYGFTTGNMQPFNGLVRMMAEANDIPADQMLLPDIPMQPVPPEEQSPENK